MYRFVQVLTDCTDYSTGQYTVPVFGGVVLPQGTIERLTGKKMTWEDEPFELKNNL